MYFRFPLDQLFDLVHALCANENMMKCNSIYCWVCCGPHLERHQCLVDNSRLLVPVHLIQKLHSASAYCKARSL